MAYTYLIQCIPTRQFYYGVRYSNNCDPSDLWNTYFTSSIYVKQLIKQYGKDSFIYEVRKIFKSKTKARLWEQKVLSRIRAADRPDFINKHISIIDPTNRVWINNSKISKFIDIILLQEFLSNKWVKGRLFSKKHKEKISQAKIGNKTTVGMAFYKTKEHREKLSKAQKGKQLSSDNPNAKSIYINGIQYQCIKDAIDATGISYYKLRISGNRSRS